MSLEDFKRYCEINKDSIRLEYRDETTHDLTVNKILSNPSLIGLRGIEEKYKNVHFSAGTNNVGTINLVFFTESEIFPYICDIRTGRKDRGCPESHLKEAYELIRDRFGLLPTRMLIWVPESSPLTKKIIPATADDVLKLIAKEKASRGLSVEVET